MGYTTSSEALSLGSADTVHCKLAARLGCCDGEKKTLKYLIFQDRFDILLEMRFSGIAEQGYKMLYGKSQTKGAA